MMFSKITDWQLFGQNGIVRFLAVMFVLFSGLNSETKAEKNSPFVLQQNDRIVFVGNTLAERMLDYGYLESILSSQYPEKNLTFRSLAWSADTVSLRPRPLNFGKLDVHLKIQKPDVVIVCFGMNESFKGSGGLKSFETGLKSFVKNLKSQKYNGKTAPRVILLSPIPHEQKGTGFPDVTTHNSHLSAYTNVVQTVAKEESSTFVNLFEKVQPFMKAKSKHDLTMNGIHQNAYGDWIISHVIADSLGLLKSPEKIKKSQDEIASSGITLQLPISVPAGIDDPAALKSIQPVLQVNGLGTGTYALKHKGTVLAKATGQEWNQGVRLSTGPWVTDAEKLRSAILEKNQQFFYRWRAVNGEYIYGRRKEPFGVVNFPPEMKKLDGIVNGIDKDIARLRKPVTYRDFEIVKTN